MKKYLSKKNIIIIVAILLSIFIVPKVNYYIHLTKAKDLISFNDLKGAIECIDSFNFKDKDEKYLRSEISKLDKSERFKYNINIALEDFNKIKEEEKISQDSLITLYYGYEKTLNKDIVKESKELNLENYLNEIKSEYLKKLKLFEITESEALKISKAPFGSKNDSIYNNKIVVKKQKALELEVYKAQIKEENDKIIAQENENKRLEELKNTKPYIGMSRDDLYRCAWGKPQDINKTTTSYGTSEQWCYYNYKYVYVDDGVVTSIQE
jgi:hypothetical protein